MVGWPMVGTASVLPVSISAVPIEVSGAKMTLFSLDCLTALVFAMIKSSYRNIPDLK
jgi:hypothetical protein